MTKKAIITGITGQDGSYLAELLLSKGYEVHGFVRRSSIFNRGRIDHLIHQPTNPEGKLILHYADLGDGNNLNVLVRRIGPDEVYNLGAQSHVRVSFEVPEYTANVTGVGVLRLLDAVRDYQDAAGKEVRFYQASSSEMFGAAPPPQNETTPFHPRSPYGAAKAFGYYIVKNYREAYGMFAVNGILFNHESERRGENFVTRKITKGVADILAGKAKNLPLGNLSARRDWGYAPEYVEAMWMMLQYPTPEDFVIGTGQSHSVKDFVEAAFRIAGLGDWEKYVVFDPYYYRPSEVENLIADASKAKKLLHWEAKVKFEELVSRMVEHDIRANGINWPR